MVAAAVVSTLRLRRQFRRQAGHEAIALATGSTASTRCARSVGLIEPVLRPSSLLIEHVAVQPDRRAEGSVDRC
jgi:hypothetical protein